MRVAFILLRAVQPCPSVASRLGVRFGARFPSYNASRIFINRNYTTTHADIYAEANKKLLSLVEEENYEQADQIRKALVEQEAEISPDIAYEKPAISALDFDISQESVAQFTVWLQLFPHREHPNAAALSGRPFRDMRRTLLESGSPAKLRPFVMRFGIIAASKGYVRAVYLSVVRAAIPFGSLKSLYGPAFLRDMETAATEYEKKYRPENIEAVTAWCREAAVEVCCQAGWLRDAIRLVLKKRDFIMQDKTYDYLVDKMRKDKTHCVQLKTVYERWNRDKALRRAGSVSPLEQRTPVLLGTRVSSCVSAAVREKELQKELDS
ncbi:hypothetical protein BDQ12DRAFT_134595 [Crucibulum laeve]|uniref:Uncharacterized protein n=1 Tax=Crucibulum laeve TaxID=68775 RepID=A0A5C3M011_9AGAR|nr:hypothetical protein BDQ12DRAFT_134595 [Crucibulum laeve]